jgi:hypothetical protein
MKGANTEIMSMVEYAIAVLAIQLGPIHGLIGLTKQLIRIYILGLRIERNAYASRHMEVKIAYLHRLGCHG